MELWDIYDRNKKRTGRTMERNDWNMKEGDFHLTVIRRCCTGRRGFEISGHS